MWLYPVPMQLAALVWTDSVGSPTETNYKHTCTPCHLAQNGSVQGVKGTKVILM